PAAGRIALRWPRSCSEGPRRPASHQGVGADDVVESSAVRGRVAGDLRHRGRIQEDGDALRGDEQAAALAGGLTAAAARAKAAQGAVALRRDVRQGGAAARPAQVQAAAVSNPTRAVAAGAAAAVAPLGDVAVHGGVGYGECGATE